MIRFEQVNVDFPAASGVIRAVKNVSLEIKKGEFFGIVGTSGAGKSTLVRTVNRLQEVSGGKVFVDGTDVTALKGQDLNRLRLKIGMIFQHFNLIRNESVAGNIAFALRASGTSPKIIPEKVSELLSVVGLADKAKQYPGDLSGGQQQRVAIARALANDPSILLCDEATSALDTETTQEIIALLRRIKETYPLTILFITHQMEVAKVLFDRIAVMSQGEIVETGSTYDIFASPRHDVTRRLVERAGAITLPPEVIERQGSLYTITYLEEHAYEPVIATLSRRFELDISIMAGKVEYIQHQPLGTLVISVTGSADEKARALQWLDGRVRIAPSDNPVQAQAGE